MSAMQVSAYDAGWDTKWDDMKKYGPFSRHLRRNIMQLIRPLRFESVLDMGCGQGTFLKELKAEFPRIEPWGVDFSSSAVQIAGARVPGGKFQVLDIVSEHLPRRFDLVVCSEVLEHIVDDVAAIRNLAQMTGKYLVVSSPQGRMRSFEAAEVGHVRNYAHGELERKLVEAGLKIKRIVEWGFPFYSPLYRNYLERTSGRGTMGQFGPGRKALALAVYSLFMLNSSHRGDELIVLAEAVSPGGNSQG